MTANTTSPARYQDASVPVAERVEDLLGRMTIEEKVAQLTGMLPFSLLGPNGLSKDRMAQELSRGIGHVTAGAMLSPVPANLIPALDQVQRYLVEETRLGIPAIVSHEALAGLVHQACYDFPTAITLAASWDPEAVEAMNGFTRRQMRALGVHQALSPNLDLARDARWGRVQETYGEDPYLGSAIGVAFVKGLQGSDPHNADRRESAMATAKHFIAYSMADGGRNIAAVQVGDREMLEVHARPFGAAIDEAGLESVMCSYSDVNGEPASGSRKLLTDTLRGILGFEGTVVADYGAVNALFTRQQTADNQADAGVQSLLAGLDVELPGSVCFTAGLAPAVADGTIDIALIDASVRRVLESKFRLGLFENPYGNLGAFEATTTVEQRAAANEIARRLASHSTVLLANPRDVLPLSTDLARIAVIGPNAHSIRNLFGGYSAVQGIEMVASGDMGLPAPVQGGEVDDNVVAVAVEKKAPSKNTGDEFGYVRRIAAVPSEAAVTAIDAAYAHTPTVLDSIKAVVSNATEVVYALGSHVHDPSGKDIAEAVQVATGSDVAILVLGDKTGLVSDAVVGEERDRSTLELAGAQRQLLEAVCATGVPVVVVLVGSQQVPVYAEDGGPAAVIFAYQPGSIGAVAIADVLFGIKNPSGKTPITIPRTAGQCPIYYGHKHGGNPRTYTDLEDSGPAYPFGHGLSYTTFEYRSIAVDNAEVGVDGTVKVSVTVANTGARDGEEVVQLYASISRRGVTRPVRELVGFQRVDLKAGGEATITFALKPAILAYYDIDMNLVMTPGQVALAAGSSSVDLPLEASFAVVGETVRLPSRKVHSTAAEVAYS